MTVRTRLLFTYLVVPCALLAVLFSCMLFLPRPSAAVGGITGFIALRVPGIVEEEEAVSILETVGFTGIVAFSTASVPVSDFVGVGRVGLDALEEIADDDPRMTPYLRGVVGIFVDRETGERTIYVPAEPDARTVLTALEAIRKNAAYGSSWRIPDYVREGARERRLLVLGFGCAVLCSFLWAHRGWIIGAVIGAGYIAGGFTAGVEISLLLPLAMYAWTMVFLVLYERSLDHLESAEAFRERDSDEDILAFEAVRRAAAAAGVRGAILAGAALAVNIGIVVVAVPLGVPGWGRWLANLFIAPLSLFCAIGTKVYVLRTLEHPLFGFRDLVPRRGRKPAVFVPVVLVAAYGIFSFSIARVNEVIIEVPPEREQTSLEQALKNEFFQTWFPFGARYELIEPGYRITLHRYPVRDGGVVYEEEPLAEFEAWTQDWTPLPDDPAAVLAADLRRSVRVVSSSDPAVYSGSATAVFEYGLLAAGLIAAVLSFPRLRRKKSAVISKIGVNR